MDIRAFVNKRRILVAPVAVVAVVVVAATAWSGRRTSLSGPITRGFFSDDDGTTYFADDVYKAFPFDHDGKQAYRAYVFRCGSTGPFVGYLGRDAGMEVKKPGGMKWVPVSSPEGTAISNVKCPDGGRPDVVFPTQ